MNSSNWLCRIGALLALTLIAGTNPCVGDSRTAGGLLEEGRKQIESAQYRQALETFERMKAVCGDNPQCRGAALFYLGRCHLELSDYHEAGIFLDQAEAVYDLASMSNELGTVWYTKGRILTAQGRYRLALQFFDKSEAVFVRTNNTEELCLVYTNRALAYGYMSEYDAALADVDRAEKLVSDKGTPKVLADLANTKAMVYAQRQDFATARHLYRKAMELYGKSGDLRGIASIHNNLGYLDEALSDFPEAFLSYQESLALSRKLNDPLGESIALNNRAGVHLWRGEYVQALQDYEAALAIAQRLGTKLFAAQRINNIGAVHLLVGDYFGARACFEEALAIARDIQVAETQAWALHNLANLAKDQGRFNESLAYSTEALSIARRIGNRHQESTAVLRLGNLFEYLGSFDDALREYRKAEALQRETGDRLFRSITLSDMANVLIREGRLTEAEANLRSSLDLRGQLGVPIVETLCRFALYYIERSRYEQADDSNAHPPRISMDDLAEASLFLAMAEHELKADSERDLMLVGYVTGRLLLERDPARALDQFDRLSAQAESNANMRCAFLGFVGEGLAQERLGRDADAEQAYRKAVRYAESIRETLDPEMKKTFLHGEEILGMRHVVPYEGLARVLFRLGRMDEALTAADFTKARSFSEGLVQTSARVSFGVDPALLESLEKTEQALKLRGRQLEKLRLSQGNELAATRIDNELRGLSERHEEAKQALRERYPSYYVSRFPGPLALAEARIKPDEWVLTYDVSDTGVLVFLLHGPEIVWTAFQPIERSALDAMIRRFRSSMEIRPGSDPKGVFAQLAAFPLGLGKQLADVLVSPALRLVPRGVPLVVVPDDCLGVIPFEMLVLNNTGKIATDRDVPYCYGVEFLGDRNDITYHQSITALALSRGEETSPSMNRKLLVVADPVFTKKDSRAGRVHELTLMGIDPEYFRTVMTAMETYLGGSFVLDELPLTGELARHLAAMYPGDCDVYTGLDASKQNLFGKVAPVLTQYAWMVIATHGYFDRRNPVLREPVLFLTSIPGGTDGFVSMSEIMGLKMKSEVVALTACQTGLGRHISGEGTMGMGRAFLYAGSKSVIMSLWSVAQSPSVDLMEHYFRLLKEGRGKVEALRLARVEIRKAGYDHPFFWAPFILVGATE